MLIESLSLAIGKGGQNVRLASKLTGWESMLFLMRKKKAAKAEKKETDSEQAEEAVKSNHRSCISCYNYPLD